MKYFIPILILLILIPLTTAIGLTFPYSKLQPLILNPGESREVSFSLINSDEQETTIEVEMVESSGIAELTDSKTTYTIKSKEEVQVNLKITIPQDAEPQEHRIAVLFKTKPSEEEGTIQFATNLGKRFSVIIPGEQQAEIRTETETQTQEPPESLEPTKKSALTTTNIILIIILIIIAIIIILRYLSKNKKTKPLETPEIPETLKPKNIRKINDVDLGLK